ncbi:MAG TPA: gliding motility-associated C-terminal domain-containing protein [Cyclobacteriaceae bacterium]
MKKLIITVIAFFGAFVAWGQSLSNQSTIYIGPTGLLYVSEDLVNNGLIVNNGDMQIGGAWTNNAQYDAGTGKITFNSDLPQTINHNAQSFSRLTISGGGVKNFQADITIINQLELQDGMLVSQNDSRIVFEQGATITGGSNQSHINGPVYHKGTGTKLFPSGNGTVYLPVEIFGIGTASEVGLTLVDLSSPQSFEFNAEMSDVSSRRYWEVDVVSGSLEGSQIALPINGDEDFSDTDLSRFVVTQSVSSPIEFESLGQSAVTGNSTNGKITSDEAITANLVSVGILTERISVYNAISADGDPRNAIMRITNITLYPKNKVSIFNRWGDKVFEISGYDNDQKAFIGNSNMGGSKELPAGTYFYVIDLGNGSELKNGYISLKR